MNNGGHIRLMAALSAALALCACHTETSSNKTGNGKGISVSVSDEGLRTVLTSDDKAKWGTDEAMGLFYSTALSGTTTKHNVNAKYSYSATSLSSTATFTGDAVWAANPSNTVHKIYVYYPYSDGNASQSKVAGTLPQTQRYAVGSDWDISDYDFMYGRNDNAAYGEKVAISLKHLFAVLRLNITNSTPSALTIRSVTIRSLGGRILAGDFYVNTSKNNSATALANTMTVPDAAVHGSNTAFGYFATASSTVTVNVSGGSVASGAAIDVRAMINAGSSFDSSVAGSFEGTANYLSGDTFEVTVQSDLGTHPAVTFTAGGTVRGGRASKSISLSPVTSSVAERYPSVAGQAGYLVADGISDTYSLMHSRGYYEECPDSSGVHATNPIKHITQTWDSTLQRYVFRFDIHIDIDDDRGLENVTDRQRVEIKTYDASPDNMVASEGQTHTYTWKFMLPAGFKATSKFCHLHQLKGYGGDDVGNPLMTLLARKSGEVQYLQVTHYGPGGAAAEILAQCPLSDFEGEWVMVTERATFLHAGSYSVRIVRLRDDKVLLDYSAPTVDIWRDGATAIRPKYGIYRYFGDGGSMKSQMRDETLYFADFTLKEE